MKLFRLFLASVFVVFSSSALADWFERGGLHNLSRKGFTKPTDMTLADASDPAQIERTWKRAIVWVPTGPNRSKRMTTKQLVAKYSNSDKKFPTAIYMHGCTGLWSGSSLRMKFLADNGFLVIGPASLARTRYAQSCDHTTHKGGMYRWTVEMRKYDAGHAIETAKTLPFVDKDNMLLIGLSEGGITTATFEAQNENQTVNARVVEGWTCTSGWTEQAGIRAPASEPVLSLVGDKDPWFVEWYVHGDCGPSMHKDNGSKSIVYKKGKLAKRHELLEFKAVQEEVLSFIKLHIDLPMGTRDVQQILTNLGFNPGPVDGAWGAKTLKALNELRAQHGLDPVGKFEETSQKLLQKLKNT